MVQLWCVFKGNNLHVFGWSSVWVCQKLWHWDFVKPLEKWKKEEDSKPQSSMLEHWHHAGLWRWFSAMISTCGQETRSAWHRSCCSQRSMLCWTRLCHGDGAGCTLFWSWKNKDERRLSGVGFMIKTSIARKLQNLPVGNSGHIVSLRLPIRTTSLPLAPVCTHLLCRLKLE